MADRFEIRTAMLSSGEQLTWAHWERVQANGEVGITWYADGRLNGQAIGDIDLERYLGEVGPGYQ